MTRRDGFRSGLAFIPVLALLAAMNLMAQQTGTTSTGTTTGGTTTGGTTTGTTTGGTSTTGSRSPSSTQQPQQPNRVQQPIFVSGTVLLSDGNPPPSQVVIERVCATRIVREGYTDSHGHFSFQLGANIGVFADASTDLSTSLGPGGFPSIGGNSSSNGQTSDTALFGCELRASLPGYRSDTLSLANRRPMDSSDIGVIVLHYFGNVKGLTTSATTALAPKDAKKAFEKGSKALEKDKPDEAQTELMKAVSLHPRFAEAWYKLGLVYERREHKDEAREAYAKAIAADGNLTPPYERLYLMAFSEGNWQVVADNTDKVLRLNPYDNPGAYYFNAVAYYQLKKFDTAEKSAREAVKITGRNANPRSFYVLGLVLAQKGEFAESASTLRTFLKVIPPDADVSRIQKLLSDVDQAAQKAQARAPQ